MFEGDRAGEKCSRCQGTGAYRWGPSVNGRTAHSGPCYRCQGKGRIDRDDERRNWGYDRYALVKALG